MTTGGKKGKKATPGPADGILATGLTHHRAGRLAEAARCYEHALAAHPSHPDALHFLGVVRHQQGDHEGALKLIERAIAGNPHDANYLINRGEALRALTRFEDARRSYESALALDPRSGAALFNLGIVLGELGRHEEAAACYRRLTQLAPQQAEAHFALGNALCALGRHEQALAPYRQAVEIRPDFVDALYSLGIALGALGRFEEAAASFRRLLAVTPKQANVHILLGDTLRSLNKDEEAAACYRQAIDLRPDSIEAWDGLQRALRQMDRIEEAKTALGRLIALAPKRIESRWAQTQLLPVVYESEEEIDRCRRLYTQNLAALEATVEALRTPDDIEAAFKAASDITNFYLAYQGEDDRALQEQYGRLLHRIMRTQFPAWANAAPPARRSGEKRLRVGFVSGFFYYHTVIRLFRHWLLKLDRTRFWIAGVHTGPKADPFTEELRGACDTFIERPLKARDSASDVAELYARIAALDLDVIVFPELGMHAPTMLLAALRLAPIQCVAIGHPVTSGLPTVDYFLSGELIEPPGAEAHYSETLVRLPNASVSYERPRLPPPTRTRRDFGIDEQAVVYLSCQSPFKYLPRHDHVFADIATQVPNSQFVFVSFLRDKQPAVHARYEKRIRAVFAARGLEADRRCVFQPVLVRGDFLELNRLSDISLDTFEWSGGNTIYEAIACGLPVLSCPGRFMRGRVGAAILTQMGMAELVASSKTDYIERAVALGRDAEMRAAVRAKIAASAHRIFDDGDAVRGLERFLEAAVAAYPNEVGGTF
jgi:predicted O-linked N-acetylglucosamine transferase (SPINDLY family)